MTLASLRRRARRRRLRRPGAPATERRLVTLVRALLLFESAMYSAVTPVLPHYAHVLHASKPAIGVLAAAYPAGLIPGAILGGWIAARAGVRRTAVAGLLSFGVAVAAFGFATNLIALDALRVIQGLFCGLIWGGALTWVIAAVPRERRGRALGSVIGAATFGTLLGPLLGTDAVAAGTRPVFAATGAIAFALAAWARRHPEPAAVPSSGETESAEAGTTAPTVRGLLGALRTPGVGLGTWLITLEAITFGAANALVPLRLAHLGGSSTLIGATFVGAAALSTALSPLVGRMTDRRGPRATMALGLASGGPLIAALVLPHTSLLLAAATVVALGAPLTACMIPSVSLMTGSAERAGVALVVATTLVNLAYAVGETIGAPVAASLSAATSDAVPLLLVAALMAGTLAAVARRRYTGSSVTSRATSAA